MRRINRACFHMKVRAAWAFSATCVFIGLLAAALESSAYFFCTSSSCANLLNMAGVSIFSIGLIALAVAATMWRRRKFV